MKTLYLTALAAALLAIFNGSVRAQHSSDDRAFFENRSSSTLYIYKAPISSRSRAVRQVEPGEVAAVPTRSGDLWIVSTPVWYRLVSSLKVTDRYSRRLTVRDSDVRAIGTKPLSTSFVNRSGTDVQVKIVVGGKEYDWLWVKNGRSIQTTSFSGQDWAVREQASGKLIQRATTPRTRSTITIDPSRRAGGGHGHGDGRGHGHGNQHDEHAEVVELSITNTTAHTIAIYKKTRFGSRRVGTIPPRRSAKIETAPGEVWRIEDTVTQEVLQTIVVPHNDPHCEVAIGRPTPPPPPAPRKIKINFHNDTDEIVYIYKMKDYGWKYTKRIYPNREYRLEFDIGQAISIRDPKSGKELESLKAPSKDMTMHIEPHGDHAHIETGSGSHGHGSKPEPEPRPSPEPLRPRDILRRILRGD